MREIEIKLRMKDLASLEEKLKVRGCVLSKPIHQHDVVYLQDGGAAYQEGIKEGLVVLRIRRDDRGAIFTLKQQRSHELDNAEYETRIEDPEALHQSLLILGFKPEIEVKKVRRTGKLGGDEICLDEVEQLGNFVELERLTGDDADPVQVTEELFRELESLGLSRADQEKRGYDTQLHQLRKKKELQ